MLTRKLVLRRPRRNFKIRITQHPSRYCSSSPGAVDTENGHALGQLDPLRKLGIIFTCTVCQTRTAKSFTHQSYTKGVVIIRCPSCDNNHLIADNLGWFRNEKVNIETLSAEKGQTVRRLTNVQDLQTEGDIEGLEKFKELFAAAAQPKASE